MKRNDPVRVAVLTAAVVLLALLPGTLANHDFTPTPSGRGMTPDVLRGGAGEEVRAAGLAEVARLDPRERRALDEVARHPELLEAYVLDGRLTPRSLGAAVRAGLIDVSCLGRSGSDRGFGTPFGGPFDDGLFEDGPFDRDPFGDGPFDRGLFGQGAFGDDDAFRGFGGASCVGERPFERRAPAPGPLPPPPRPRSGLGLFDDDAFGGFLDPSRASLYR